MNGSLYPQPQGSLMDPRSAMIMQMGLGLMANSGPSRTPVSLGQSFGQAGMQGMQAYNQTNQANQQQQMFAMKMAEVQREAEERKRKEAAMAAVRADPRFAQYAPLLEAGLPLSSVLEREMPKPQTLSPGGMLVGPDGKIIVQAPFKPEPAPEAKPPMTRKIRIGEDEVSQEYVDGAWREVGRGPAFAKTVEGVPKPVVAPKPPKDYEWTDDTYTETRPIKGGPKDTSAKDAARAQGAIQKADTVIAKVDEALAQVGFSSTGLTGSVLGMVPGTKAYDLDKTIDTIKANLGFSELQAMREASPTGGALGQVAIQELAMLQSTIASLDKGQSPENLKRGLEQVRKHFSNWKKAVMDAQQGADPQAPAAAQAPKRRVYDPKSGTFK